MRLVKTLRQNLGQILPESFYRILGKVVFPIHYVQPKDSTEESQCGACATKSNWTLVSFFGLSNSPLFLKKKVRVKFVEFRWFENKILVPIWSEVESIAIRLFNHF